MVNRENLMENSTFCDSKSITDSKLAEMMYASGIRPSVQRIAILSYIANARRHPTADEIYTELAPKFPSLSRTTVYNSLHTLVAASLVRELEIESGNRHYDLAPQPSHSHFICRKCGRIFDMAIPDGVCSAATPGFCIDSVDVYFKGLCPDCRE